jgi:AcrR family transcriptional regulator
LQTVLAGGAITMVAKRSVRSRGRARERLLNAAYDLFAARGVRRVGVDTILARAGCAKASLYGNFRSKVELAVAFLERRERLWTRAWLETAVRARSHTPTGRLLAIFDVFHEWFQRSDFEGCSFINVLLESDAAGPVHRAAVLQLAKIRGILRSLAREARLAEPERFAQTWHMLMKGSIVSACEGHRGAAREAKQAARLVLSGWPRRTTAQRRAASP